ncbi:hypothetical protein [Noviherbaspirillum autotrophicum]|uniref:Uncharacterized protein n=1 Tax=Noviherbaspirillum autotrophicum TaxID=709839 RepID=A0A0C2BEZ5_9BURK|nr:hypothetical protein [Noviherbaspirillum autotrophicum]KIF79805.1 hypothetical protein TSA66_01495 [Noviherbaspirillum autotrophicum]
MLLFLLWAVLALAALAGAGYSHYRYRVIHNQYYERLFASNRDASDGADIGHHPRRANPVSVVTLVLVSLLVPVSLVI